MVPLFFTMNSKNDEFSSAEECISNFDFGLQSADLLFLRTDTSLLGWEPFRAMGSRTGYNETSETS